MICGQCALSKEEFNNFSTCFNRLNAFIHLDEHCKNLKHVETIFLKNLKFSSDFDCLRKLNTTKQIYKLVYKLFQTDNYFFREIELELNQLFTFLLPQIKDAIQLDFNENNERKMNQELNKEFILDDMLRKELDEKAFIQKEWEKSKKENYDLKLKLIGIVMKSLDIQCEQSKKEKFCHAVVDLFST